MDEMIRAMTPVLLANAATLLYVYGVWKLSKWTDAGRPKARFGESIFDLALVAIPPLVLLYGLILWGFADSTPLRHLLAEPQTQTQAR